MVFKKVFQIEKIESLMDGAGGVSVGMKRKEERGNTGGPEVCIFWTPVSVCVTLQLAGRITRNLQFGR